LNAHDDTLMYLIKVLRGPIFLKKRHKELLKELKAHLAQVEKGNNIDPVILNRIGIDEKNNRELEEFVNRTKNLRAELIKAFREAKLND